MATSLRSLVGIRRPVASIPRALVIFLAAIGAALVGASYEPVVGQVEPAANPTPAAASDAPIRAVPATPPATWITIRLPITGDVDTRAMEQIERARQMKPATDGRHVLVLEFRGPDGPTGDADVGASQFERSLALARYLTSDRLRQVRTVAFVTREVSGHAVLPFVACEEWVLAPDAVVGDASRGDSFVDPTVRSGYEEIAERRRAIPVPIVLGMLDPALAVYRVRTPDGPRFVTGGELERLQKETSFGEIETVKREGEKSLLTGRDLRLRWGIAGHEATDRVSLAAALNLPVAAFSAEFAPSDGWRPARVDLHGPLNARQLQWVRKSVAAELHDGTRNLLLLSIDSPGGTLADSLSFAAFLASLPEHVRTVAYVPREARGDAAIIALACDHLVVGELATVGGPGADAPDASLLDQLRGPLEPVAARNARSWSMLAAMVDSRAELLAFERQVTNEKRWMTETEWRELADREQWRRGAPVDTANGISGRRLMDAGIAHAVAANFDDLRAQYPFEGEALRVEPNWAFQIIEGLSAPGFAWLLLFLAWFALMVELMTPNLTGAGLVSAVLFLLFFWSQFLHGTAGWLEVLLFAVGVGAVLLEIFVIPGFGVFGLGGGLLIITSLVLASQTFVIPRNAYQVAQLPSSLWTVVAALAGGVAAVAIARRFLPHSRYFQRLTLAAPGFDEQLALARRESLVDRSHLVGQVGVTTTPLVPGGKAQFGEEVVDVLSEGVMVPRGARVEVLETLGNRVLVRMTSD